MSATSRRVKYSWANIDWITAPFLVLSPIISAVLIYTHVTVEGFNSALLLPAFLMYLLTGISVTAGYHRLFAHRAYKANTFLRAFYLIFGAAGFASSALDWATNHRDHHNYVDTDKDPHNYNEGFFHAHFGWLLFKFDLSAFPKDLLNDKLVVMQHKYFIWIGVFVSLVTGIGFGFAMGSPIGGIAIVFFGRVVMTHQVMFFINSLCHCVGTQLFDVNQTAKDNYWVAFFTLGEGYHNFHHKFQSDYRNGLRWYDFDPTKWTINVTTWLGLSYDKKTVPEALILKAKMESQQARFAEKMAKKRNEENVEVHLEFPQLMKLKEQVQIAQRKYCKLKREYKSATEQLKADAQKNMRIAKSELAASYDQWLLSLKELPQLV